MNFSAIQTRKEKNKNILHYTLKYTFLVKQVQLTSLKTKSTETVTFGRKDFVHM